MQAKDTVPVKEEYQSRNFISTLRMNESGLYYQGPPSAPVAFHPSAEPKTRSSEARILEQMLIDESPRVRIKHAPCLQVLHDHSTGRVGVFLSGDGASGLKRTSLWAIAHAGLKGVQGHLHVPPASPAALPLRSSPQHAHSGVRKPLLIEARMLGPASSFWGCVDRCKDRRLFVKPSPCFASDPLYIGASRSRFREWWKRMSRLQRPSLGWAAQAKPSNFQLSAPLTDLNHASDLAFRWKGPRRIERRIGRRGSSECSSSRALCVSWCGAEAGVRYRRLGANRLFWVGRPTAAMLRVIHAPSIRLRERDGSAWKSWDTTAAPIALPHCVAIGLLRRARHGDEAGAPSRVLCMTGAGVLRDCVLKVGSAAGQCTQFDDATWRCSALKECWAVARWKSGFVEPTEAYGLTVTGLLAPGCSLRYSRRRWRDLDWWDSGPRIAKSILARQRSIDWTTSGATVSDGSGVRTEGWSAVKWTSSARRFQPIRDLGSFQCWHGSRGETLGGVVEGAFWVDARVMAVAMNAFGLEEGAAAIRRRW
ncbi:hypothetical protein DFP72DRAFT_1042551, partial [Ephemerocybe angulata]